MKKWKKGLLIALCVLLTLVLLALIFVTVYAKHLLGKIDRIDPQTQTLSSSELEAHLRETDAPDPSFTGEYLSPEDVTWATQPPEATEPEKADHMLNIMLIGQDSRSSKGRARSDSMILCSINKQTGKLTMTSLQRDMWVQIPGYHDNRINASYAFGGIQLFEKTLQKNFGIQLDGVVEVNFQRFTKIIDKVGGVKVELTQREAAYLGVKPGLRKLDGETALRYCRIRYLDSDFKRAGRQRKVITALLDSCRDKSLAELSGLLEYCLDMVTTNLTDQQILQYTLELFPILKNLTIESGSVPSKGNYRNANIGGKYVLIPDMEYARNYLQAVTTGQE